MKYHVARDGQPIGIFLEYEVKDGLRKGELRASDLYWREGMPEWVPISEAAEVADALKAGAGINPYAPPATDLAKDDDTVKETGVVLATLNQRLLAALLDFSTVFPFAVCYFSALRLMGPTLVPTPTSGMLLLVGGIGIISLFICNITLLWTRGQTLGKMWVNIRIANLHDAGNPGPVKAILLRWFCSGLMSAIPILGLVYAITDVLFIFRVDRRCLHDLLADTRVVQGSIPERR